MYIHVPYMRCVIYQVNLKKYIYALACVLHVEGSREESGRNMINITISSIQLWRGGSNEGSLVATDSKGCAMGSDMPCYAAGELIRLFS